MAWFNSQTYSISLYFFFNLLCYYITPYGMWNNDFCISNLKTQQNNYFNNCCLWHIHKISSWVLTFFFQLSLWYKVWDLFTSFLFLLFAFLDVEETKHTVCRLPEGRSYIFKKWTEAYKSQKHLLEFSNFIILVLKFLISHWLITFYKLRSFTFMKNLCHHKDRLL